MNEINPIPELISDEMYQFLQKHDLFDEIKIRNYKIRMKYRKYRDDTLKAEAAIELLRTEYSYLQFDTIKKICSSGSKERKVA